MEDLKNRHLADWYLSSRDKHPRQCGVYYSSFIECDVTRYLLWDQHCVSREEIDQAIDQIGKRLDHSIEFRLYKYADIEAMRIFRMNNDTPQAFVAISYMMARGDVRKNGVYFASCIEDDIARDYALDSCRVTADEVDDCIDKLNDRLDYALHQKQWWYADVAAKRIFNMTKYKELRF